MTRSALSDLSRALNRLVKTRVLGVAVSEWTYSGCSPERSGPGLVDKRQQDLCSFRRSVRSTVWGPAGRVPSPSSTDLTRRHIYCSVRPLTTKQTSEYDSFVIGCILVSLSSRKLRSRLFPLLPVNMSSDPDSVVTPEVAARSPWQAQNKNLSLKYFFTSGLNYLL